MKPLGLVLSAVLATVAPAQTLSVMTFNVRYPNPNDGEDVWERRRDLLVETIRRYQPDVMGTQELFKQQGDYIVAQQPEYAWFGVSRRGNEQDEHMGVFYKRGRVKVIEQGNFWLSETPEAPGSQSWGMSLPRMVTWGLLEHRSGRRFYIFNTHFAHRREDEAARLHSAAVFRERLRALPAGVPVIVTGDFNAPAGGEVHKAMLAAGLRDTRGTGGRDSGPEGTFHGFRGVPGRERIDWILVSPAWGVISNETVIDQRNGRYPSDHFPVVAKLRFPARGRQGR